MQIYLGQFLKPAGHCRALAKAQPQLSIQAVKLRSNQNIQVALFEGNLKQAIHEEPLSLRDSRLLSLRLHGQVFGRLILSSVAVCLHLLGFQAKIFFRAKTHCLLQCDVVFIQFHT